MEYGLLTTELQEKSKKAGRTQQAAKTVLSVKRRPQRAWGRAWSVKRLQEAVDRGQYAVGDKKLRADD